MTTRKTVTVHPAGPSFAGLLAILFIGLKLGGVIAWSWRWVLAPLWAPLALLLAVTLVGLVVWLIAIGILALMDGSKR